MVAISQRLEKQYPKSNRGKIVEPMAMQDFLVGGVRRSLWVLQGAVALVMLVGSVNLAGLLLARSSARAGEFALRTAIGAVAQPAAAAAAGRGRAAGAAWAAAPACWRRSGAASCWSPRRPRRSCACARCRSTPACWPSACWRRCCRAC